MSPALVTPMGGWTNVDRGVSRRGADAKGWGISWSKKMGGRWDKIAIGVDSQNAQRPREGGCGGGGRWPARYTKGQVDPVPKEGGRGVMGGGVDQVLKRPQKVPLAQGTAIPCTRHCNT